jgi:hypothetical protein
VAQKKQQKPPPNKELKYKHSKIVDIYKLFCFSENFAFGLANDG